MLPRPPRIQRRLQFVAQPLVDNPRSRTAQRLRHVG